ncbi:MAG: hypothetical protein ABJM79_13120 [Anderseniella sp.]
MLNPFMDPGAGDISVDIDDENPPFHPHITAPYLQEILSERGPDVHLEYFVSVRHPLRMLESYYKFFVPDENSRYFYSPDYTGRRYGMSFEEWVLKGRVELAPDWERLAPEYITATDLTPLSLEAFAMCKDGSWATDHVFRIEEMDKIREWLSEKLGSEVEGKHVNRSEDMETPPLGSEALSKVRTMFPHESEIYGV